jgi:hypothetical protein
MNIGTARSENRQGIGNIGQTHEEDPNVRVNDTRAHLKHLGFQVNIQEGSWSIRSN